MLTNYYLFTDEHGFTKQMNMMYEDGEEIYLGNDLYAYRWN